MIILNEYGKFRIAQKNQHSFRLRTAAKHIRCAIHVSTQEIGYDRKIVKHEWNCGS